MPFKMLVATLDIDLLETDALFASVQRQYVRSGIEVPLWAIDLRGGLYKNIALDDDPFVYSLASVWI